MHHAHPSDGFYVEGLATARLAALRLRLKPTKDPVFSNTLRTLERLLILFPFDPSGLALPSLSLMAFSTILLWVGLSLKPSAMLLDDGDLDMLDDFVLAEEDEDEDCDRVSDKDERRPFFSFFSFFSFSFRSFSAFFRCSSWSFNCCCCWCLKCCA